MPPVTARCDRAAYRGRIYRPVFIRVTTFYFSFDYGLLRRPSPVVLGARVGFVGLVGDRAAPPLTCPGPAHAQDVTRL
jgi:hypothetical protein